MRGVDFSNTSRIVTFLTPDRGRLACMAKGARRARSPFAGVLDTFNRVELVYYWKEGRGVQQLAEVAPLNTFGLVKSDLEKATFAAVPIELAGKIAHENEPSAMLYERVVSGLDTLGRWSSGVLTHVCWQVFHLLAVAGFEPTLTACVHCGGRIDKPAGFAYEGGVVCRSCAYRVRDGQNADSTYVKLNQADYEALRNLAGHPRTCPQVRVSEDVFGWLCGYALHHIDGDLRSVRVVREILGM